MGNGIDKFAEISMKDESPSTTKRPLDKEYDPRSPSTEISRTPIQIEKTPSVMQDPRSPTSGIDRTPIYNCGPQPNKEKAAPLNVAPLKLDMDSTMDDTFQSAVDDQEKLSLEGSTEMLLRKPETPQPKTDNTDKEKNSSFLSRRKKSKKVPNPEQENTPLKATPDVSKMSPRTLRTIDVNSPRAIVQRKQTNKLEMNKRGFLTSTPNKKVAATKMMSPKKMCKYQIFHDEKENINP